MGKLHVFVIGYWPFLSVDPTQSLELDQVEPLLKKLMEMPIPDVKGILWASGDEGIGPVLIVERGDELYHHMNRWAEESISEWFRIYIDQPPNMNNRYVVAIVPRIERSLERWKIAYGIKHKVMPPDDLKVTMPFRGIEFGSSLASPGYELIKNKFPAIGSSIPVGILDLKHIDLSDPNSVHTIDSTLIQTLGLLELSDPLPIRSHLIEILVNHDQPNPHLKSWINPNLYPEQS